MRWRVSGKRSAVKSRSGSVWKRNGRRDSGGRQRLHSDAREEKKKKEEEKKEQAVRPPTVVPFSRKHSQRLLYTDAQRLLFSPLLRFPLTLALLLPPLPLTPVSPLRHPGHLELRGPEVPHLFVGQRAQQAQSLRRRRGPSHRQMESVEAAYTPTWLFSTLQAAFCPRSG